MNRGGQIFILGLALAALVAGLSALFRLRLGQGDLFPVYSSLRADPLGTLALHDSLAQLPGLRVERRMKPLTSLEAALPRTILLAGVHESDWTQLTTEEFNALDSAVRAGSRLVIAMRQDTADTDAANAAADQKKRDAAKKKSGEKQAEKRPKIAYADLHRLWGVDLLNRGETERPDGAVLIRGGADRLPERVGWRSNIYFKPAQGVEWRPIYRRGIDPVLMERRLGLGSIVLAGDSYFLSNEALQLDRPTALLAWIVGPQTRVTFDESHLGVIAEPGIAALARRYGLSGAFFTLVLLAALFVWRRMALFVPPAGETREVALAYHPAAGLEALLHRAVTPGELVTVGVAEWKRTARTGDEARATAALAAAPEKASAVERYNLITRALRRR